MLIHEWYHIPTWLSLMVIAIVLIASIGFSMKADRTKPTARWRTTRSRVPTRPSVRGPEPILATG